jgi:hypothetical protein
MDPNDLMKHYQAMPLPPWLPTAPPGALSDHENALIARNFDQSSPGMMSNADMAAYRRVMVTPNRRHPESAAPSLAQLLQGMGQSRPQAAYPPTGARNARIEIPRGRAKPPRACACTYCADAEIGSDGLEGNGGDQRSPV